MWRKTIRAPYGVAGSGASANRTSARLSRTESWLPPEPLTLARSSTTNEAVGTPSSFAPFARVSGDPGERFTEKRREGNLAVDATNTCRIKGAFLAGR